MKDSVLRTKKLKSPITLITAIRMFLNKILFGLLLCSLFSSCIVSKKKYDALLAQKIQTNLDELFKILESN